MKTLLLLLALCLLPVTASAQVTRITSGSSLPTCSQTPSASCIHLKTGTAAGFYIYLSGWVGPFATPIGNVTTSATLTAHQVVLGNGTVDVKVVGALGSSGECLTSNGEGSDPSWQACSGGGGGGSYIPLVDGSEPPAFITDGAGVLILVAYP